MLSPGDLVYSKRNKSSVQYRVISVTNNIVTLETLKEGIQIAQVNADILVAVGKKIQECSHCKCKTQETSTIDGRLFCIPCSDSTQKCKSCGLKRILSSKRIGEKRIYLCADCWNNYIPCSHCNKWILKEDAIKSPKGDYLYCSKCGDLVLYPQFRHSRREYNYVPDKFIFTGEDKDNLYLGIELECANIGQTRDNNVVCGILEKESGGFLYGMFDSSINASAPRERNGDGIEVVSHPATFSWWKENKGILDLILSIRDWGFRAYHAKMCGMHVHLSRNAFDSNTMKSFLHLFFDNPDFWSHISEKQSSALNAYASFNLPQEEIESIVAGGITPNKYYAIRATRNTLELRIFIGALDEVYFYRTLEVAHAAFKFAASKEKNTIEKFLEYVYSKPKKYSNLIYYLNKKLAGTQWATANPPSPLVIHPCA